MSDATCKTCLWIGETVGLFDMPHDSGIGTMKERYDFPCCRKDGPPWGESKAVDPERDWCSHHPARREQG